VQTRTSAGTQGCSTDGHRGAATCTCSQSPFLAARWGGGSGCWRSAGCRSRTSRGGRWSARGARRGARRTWRGRGRGAGTCMRGLSNALLGSGLCAPSMPPSPTPGRAEAAAEARAAGALARVAQSQRGGGGGRGGTGGTSGGRGHVAYAALTTARKQRPSTSPSCQQFPQVCSLQPELLCVYASCCADVGMVSAAPAFLPFRASSAPLNCLRVPQGVSRVSRTQTGGALDAQAGGVPGKRGPTGGAQSSGCRTSPGGHRPSPTPKGRGRGRERGGGGAAVELLGCHIPAQRP